MFRPLLAAFVAVPLLGAGAAGAQGYGYVVPDPYGDFPPIRLQRPAPQHLPPIGAVPYGHYPPAAVAPAPLTPGEALGLIIRDRLVRELDRALPGARDRGERWRGRPYHFADRWRNDDDDRDDDDWDDRDDDRDDDDDD